MGLFEPNDEKSMMKAPADAQTGHINLQCLAVIATYQCTASCHGCCFDSGPDQKARLSLDAMKKAIDNAAASKLLSLVTFTGGECFLLGKDLTDAVAYATGKGVKVRVVSNGFWAKNYRSGLKLLEELKTAGLKEISLSTGDYHLEFVDYATVVNAILISLELSLKVDVMVELTGLRRITSTDLMEDPAIKKSLEKGEQKLTFMDSPWMPMDYRAIEAQNPAVLLNKDNIFSFKGCDSILTTMAITPDGGIGLCCGLSRNHIPELNVPYGEFPEIAREAGEDFMKIWLLVDGPERILAWVASKDPSIEWEGRYAHRCHACLALYHDPAIQKVIRKHYRERTGDVLLRYSIILQAQRLMEGVVYA